MSRWDVISAQPASGAAFNHIPGGCNVLFMDGHVEFVKMGDTFPVTLSWARFMTGVYSLR